MDFYNSADAMRDKAMVEYSAGYKEKARRKLEALDSAMSVKARGVARGLTSHFEKSSTKTPGEQTKETAPA